MRTELRYMETVNRLKSYDQLEHWEARRSELQERILVSAGLWPLPHKCNLNAKIFDKITYDDFTIEKVVFESYPGYYVTGNLYRPLNKSGLLPGILNPHGHWSHGRLEMVEDGTSEQPVEIPTRCANFAKMGMAAFSYDMVGYLDSKQVGHAYDGEEQQIWGIGLLGLQLWNSIRSLDFLLNLPEIDAQNIGCTGASGGATQAFLLGAVDERLKASVPVNMVSAHFQGGCRCENAPHLRIDANNVEFTAMFAPRPLLVVGCTGDWSRNVPTVEYPALREIYKLYGAEDKVDYFYDDANHNYNKNTREAVYRWFGKQLAGRDEPWKEQKVNFGDLERFRIFSDGFPSRGVSSKAELFALQKREKQETLQQLWNSKEPEDKQILLTAMQHSLCVPQLSDAFDVQEIQTNALNDDERDFAEPIDVRRMSISNESEGTPISLLLARNKSIEHNGKTVFMVHPGGKKGLLRDEKWKPMLESYLDEGYAIATATIHLTEGFGTARDCICMENITTYNLTDTTLRVHDIISVFKFLQSESNGELNVVGIGEAGGWTLAALPYLHGVNTAAIEMNEYMMDVEDDAHFATRFFVPHFRSAGSFVTSVIHAAAKKLVLFNMGENNFAQVLRSALPKGEKELVLLKHFPEEIQ
ncbi:hypothetical protein FHS15_003855 [Paenibacillus castaneae]|uniref:alpha/beta hydrolase family protein n=1 Tax=Paenibacillus castaneae TaxID=474957 RepID=UPI000C9C600C|nr:hypothetical protein [Paenibacillus castaneae]NIK78709.1 hypothetical protein [Paenibacillus castaneae]